jgi:hypothetical protein
VTDDPTPEEFDSPEVTPIEEEEQVTFYTPDPPAHVTNLTPDLPQPEGFEDHAALVARKEAAARAYLKEVEEEYGKYVATSDILTPGGVLAYRKGAAVPASNVKLHGYDVDNLVEKVK